MVRFAGWLRKWADRIDSDGAPKALGWSFTFENGEGIRFRDDRVGCRLWYYGDADYDRAHTEADSTAKDARRDAEVGQFLRSSGAADLADELGLP